MQDYSPLVTIYITNYNYGCYIAEAVESLLAQTFQDFEIIIIDDGSTDNSKEVIDSYVNHPKIEIIFQKNKGLNVTNNIAIRIAQGKYIMRLDADDYLEKDALEIMVNRLEEDKELGLIFPDYYLVDKDRNIIGHEQRHSFNEVSLFDQPAHGACTMIRLKFLQDIGGYDESFSCQDGYELWINFIAHFKVDNINKPLFYYRQHGSNLTRNENRILDTRRQIKESFVKKNDIKLLNTIAIIPIRTYGPDSYSIALEEIGEQLVIDRKIEAALNARNISKVIVSTPGKKIKEYVEQKYANESRLIFIDRPKYLARINVDLKATIQHILDNPEIQKLNPEAFVSLSIDNPFTTSAQINDAVYTTSIFNTDSLISVRADNSMFFQHHGEGMKPILNHEKFTRLEREALYKYAGGIMLTTVELFLRKTSFLGDRVGHIVVDEKSAHVVRTKHDLEIARFLIREEFCAQA